jgi:NhaC family Na+:H+ antiporter
MIILTIFSAILIVCISLGQPILIALAAGYILFSGYAISMHYAPVQVLKMSLQGIRTVKNIIILFILIGMLTASWRTAGTLPLLISYAVEFIQPEIMILAAFLLNCLVSALMGTSFGTAATMGVVTISIANALQISPVAAGGAILSGIYFGDRCSPVSSSALLIAELTHTNIFHNIKQMLRTAFVPFMLTLAIYAALGLLIPSTAGTMPDMYHLFAKEFRLELLTLLPAACIVLLSLLRINVKLTLAASILTAVVLSITMQQQPPYAMLEALITGYRSQDPAIATLLNGGGIVSMLNVTAIICLTSSFAGIFAATRLLEPLKQKIASMSKATFPFCGTIITSLIASMIACNQALAIMLTHQICAPIAQKREALAVDLENTVVVISPLIPWSIAAAVPLTAINAPATCLSAACYLYLLPLWQLLWQFYQNKHQKPM